MMLSLYLLFGVLFLNAWLNKSITNLLKILKESFYFVQIRKVFLLRLKLVRTAGSKTHQIVLSSLIQLKWNDEHVRKSLLVVRSRRSFHSWDIAGHYCAFCPLEDNLYLFLAFESQLGGSMPCCFKSIRPHIK